MDVLQHFDIGFGVFGLKIDDLPTDHALDRARAVRDLFDDAHPGFSRAAQPRQHFVGLGLQRVSRQDSDGFAENFVAGGPAPAQIIVVERGQIVMNQRIGVQHFERRAQFLNARGKRSRDHASGFHAKDRPQPLAAREHAVPHRLVDRNRALRGRRQQALQGGVGQRLPLLQSLVEHAGEYNKGGYSVAVQVLCLNASSFLRASRQSNRGGPATSGLPD